MGLAINIDYSQTIKKIKRGCSHRADQLIDKVVEMALASNIGVLRLCRDRLLPAGTSADKGSARFSAGCFWDTGRPSHDAVLELLLVDVILACADPSAHGDAGVMDCLRIA